MERLSGPLIAAVSAELISVLAYLIHPVVAPLEPNIEPRSNNIPKPHVRVIGVGARARVSLASMSGITLSGLRPKKVPEKNNFDPKDFLSVWELSDSRSLFRG